MNRRAIGAIVMCLLAPGALWSQTSPAPAPAPAGARRQGPATAGALRDSIDRDLFIARTSRIHTPDIANLSSAHSLPQTANYLLRTISAGAKDPDTARILAAIRTYRDADLNGPTPGCYWWYVEAGKATDTNASFFICSPLTALWLGYRDRLSDAELRQLQGVFADVLPWFTYMSKSPKLYYPNKCVSDAAMLLAAGHVLGDARVIDAGRDFANRCFDYYAGRGVGWGEDLSPNYSNVIVEMTTLIMALEKSGPVYDKARRLTDAICQWVNFNDGIDSVPSIRGYNYDGQIRVNYGARALFEGQSASGRSGMLSLFKSASGYSYRPQPLTTPRQRRARTFDDQFATSYIDQHARLGTLSEYPLMPDSYMHDTWGLGWQSKPAAFIVGNEEYGVLEWQTVDDAGVVRRHEAFNFNDWQSRPLFKSTGLLPDVMFVAHQEKNAAIIFREIHNLSSPTRQILDQWRMTHSAGRILIGGKPWDGNPVTVEPQWIVLQYADASVAIHPLKCRIADDPANASTEQRDLGRVVDLPVRIEKTDHGIVLGLRLVDGHEGLLTQHLLFSGWAIVLLDRPEDAAGLSVTESLTNDGEIPRPYGELTRTVELTTPRTHLRLTRDMLTGRTMRFINDQPFTFTLPPSP